MGIIMKWKIIFNFFLGIFAEGGEYECEDDVINLTRKGPVVPMFPGMAGSSGSSGEFSFNFNFEETIVDFRRGCGGYVEPTQDPSSTDVTVKPIKELRPGSIEMQ